MANQPNQSGKPESFGVPGPKPNGARLKKIRVHRAKVSNLDKTPIISKLLQMNNNILIAPWRELSQFNLSQTELLTVPHTSPIEMSQPSDLNSVQRVLLSNIQEIISSSNAPFNDSSSTVYGDDIPIATESTPTKAQLRSDNLSEIILENGSQDLGE